MIEYWSRGIAMYLVEHEAAEEAKREIIQYGLHAILLKIIQITILAVLSQILGVFWNTMAFILFYCSLRRYAGGAHAKTQSSCILWFTLVAIAASLLAATIHPYLSFGLLLFCVVIVFIKAPTKKQNDCKSPACIKRLRRISRLIVCLQMLFLMGIYLLQLISNNIITAAVLGTTVASYTLLIVNKQSEDQ